MSIEKDKILLAKAVLEIYKDNESDSSSSYYGIATCKFCGTHTLNIDQWEDHEAIIHTDECPVLIAKETVKDVKGLEIREH